MTNQKTSRAFTLIELLIVVAIIAVLAAIVFVSLDPLQRFQEARNSSRWSDMNALINAIKVDQVDNGGSYLTAITDLTDDTAYMVGTGAGCNTGCTATTTQAACADLTGLATEGYIPSVPQDPSTGVASSTDYYIVRHASGAVTVGACDPEGGDTINIKQ